jgi:hypothetical protein
VLDISDSPAPGGIDDLVLHWRAQQRDPLEEFAKLPRRASLATASNIVVTPAAEILTRPPTAWVVKDLIPANELVAIVGPTNCGKTFLTMDLLLAVARGNEHWFGKRIRRYGSVVHVTLEGGGLRNRLTAYMQHHKLDALTGYHAVETPINLRESEQTDAIIAAVAALPQPPVLIAIDTVNRALGGGDENSSTDMGALLANAERIKAAFPNSAVLLVHHLGKDASKGARGHSSLFVQRRRGAARRRR